MNSKNVNKLKILIAYHKPADLFKSEIFVPIQVGRSVANKKSKDGKLSSTNQKWLEDNMIGDDTGENISEYNRFFNETTAIYWAWKNKDKLDFPDFIGLMHYRRHFIFKPVKLGNKTWLPNSSVYIYEKISPKYNHLLDSNYINDLIKDYDILATKPYNANNLVDGIWYRNCKERFVQVAQSSPYWYEKMEETVRKHYPEYECELEELSNIPSHYLCNMFVMKALLFDEYCNFLFTVLFEVFTEFKKEIHNEWETRAIGFLAEFLTSIFISHYKKQYKDKVKELDITYLEEIDKRSFLEKIPKFIYRKNKYASFTKIVILNIVRIYKNNKTKNEMQYLKQQINRNTKLLEDLQNKKE